MWRVKVVVVPVGLVPTPRDSLRMMAFAPHGEFVSAEARSPATLEACVQDLASSATAGLPTTSLLQLEQVAFVPAGEGITLIYTTVVPLVAWHEHETEVSAEDWVLLTPWVGRGQRRERESVSREHALVRNYWRRQLEETSAALDFLPKYFTTAQVRAAYDSLWAEEQHVGAFHRWLHDREVPTKTPLVAPADEDVVRRDAERAFESALKSSDLGPQMQTITPAAAASAGGLASVAAGHAVGLSSAMIARGALGFLPAALVAGGVAGSVVAYQRRVGRGKKPLWYTRAERRRILIDDPYAPRPRWLPTGEEPATFH